MFNEGGYFERARAGHLIESVLAESPASQRAGEPAGTLSQLVAYVEFDGTKVAEIHQYRRKDGDIGASGRPDPKKLFMGGTLYVLSIVNHSS